MIHLAADSVIWTIVSFSFMGVSLWAIRIFRERVEGAETNGKGELKIYSLYNAKHDLRSEYLRFSQHFASWLIGLIAAFITPVPVHQIPDDARVFGIFVIFILFWLNLATGINTLRALQKLKWNEQFVNTHLIPTIIRKDAVA